LVFRGFRYDSSRLYGTVNEFGGSSVTEYGSLLSVDFPVAGPTTINQFEDFNSGNIRNPCPA
jgi:hypothetical protein